MFPIQPTQYDICFNILGFPVRVNPFFWFIIALLGAGGGIGNMPLWFARLSVWIAAAFVSILVHELGHALVFRCIFNVQSNIFLYGMGGATVPVWNHYKTNNFGGMLKEVFLSFAGPLAGFILAAVVIFLFALLGAARDGLPAAFLNVMLSSTYMFEIAGVNDAINGGVINPKYFVVLFFSELIFISIFWGIFNLLPIYPMDGGHITREVFDYLSPRRGISNSLVLSMFTSIVMLLLVLSVGMLFAAMLFGFFAYQNYQELRFRTF